MPAVARRDALLGVIQAGELAALTRLTASTRGQSLCSPSRAAGALPSLKYDEGMAAAYAEARRVIARLPGTLPEGDQCVQALRDIRDRWEAQRGSLGRSGPQWAEYLSGGLAACEQLLAE